jgi:hypothetical protein
MGEHGTYGDLRFAAGWDEAPVLRSGSISTSRGLSGEGQDPVPQTIELVIRDDADGTYSPLNVSSSLYGTFGRNTPVRVYSDGSARCTGEIATYRPGRTTTADDRAQRWTGISAAGMLRRLQQGKTPLRSTLYRSISTLANPPVGYWPLEEGKYATQARSGLVGGEPLRLVQGQEFGYSADDGPAGSDRLPVPVNGSVLEGRILASSYPGAWAVTDRFTVFWVMKVPASVASDTVVLEWFHTGSIARYEVVVTTAGVVDVRGYSAANVETLSFNGFDLTLGGFDGENLIDTWLAFTITTEDQGGGMYAVTLAYSLIASLIIGGVSQTITFSLSNLASANTGRPEGRVRVAGGNGIAIGHVSFHPDRTFNSLSGWGNLAAAAGWPGERAGTRFARLCTENGIPYSIIGDEDDTQQCGPQTVATLAALLRETVKADDGILFELRDDLELVMRTGRSRYNQDTALAVEFDGYMIAPLLEPIVDDQSTRNDVTAKRLNGSEYQAVQATGPLNVNNPIDDPDGVGRYDVTVDVNVAFDDQLVDRANWELAKGTIAEPRWPNIVLDLDRNPEIISDVNALEIGDRIELSGLPDEWSADTAALLVLGIRETLPPMRRKVTLVTVPASVYEVGIVGANDGSTNLRGQRVDTAKSTLDTGIDDNDTALSVTSTDGVRWTTTAAHWSTSLNGGGLYVNVGGEKMRVTNIAGAGATQTFTVTRSENGVVKAHAAGTPVRVWSPVRVGL